MLGGVWTSLYSGSRSALDEARCLARMVRSRVVAGEACFALLAAEEERRWPWPPERVHPTEVG